MSQKRADSFIGKNKQDLEELICESENSYTNDYGLRKRFIAAFLNDLSDSLSEEIASMIIIVRANGGVISQNSLKAWNKKNQQEKLKKFADTLYEIRSTYTHASIRTFMPRMVLSSAILKNGTIILYRKNKKSFLQLLKDIILELAFTLINNEKT